MIRNIIRTAVAVLSRTAYEDGRRDGAGLVPRRELEEALSRVARAEENLSSYEIGAKVAHGMVVAERDEARAELEAAKERAKTATQAAIDCLGSVGPENVDAAMGRMVAELEAVKIARNAWKAERDRIRDILDRVPSSAESQPAAYPWSDEAVERAYAAFQKTVSRYGSDDMQEEAELAGISAALATIAPPPQAAPVPPVGVGDVWGEEAVRVVKGDFDHVVMVGGHIVDLYTSGGHANSVAEDIRRGLASLPPLRAVLMDASVKAMHSAHEEAFCEMEGHERCRAAALEAALAAANIRVLGPGEGVVRVRVANGTEDVGPCVFDGGDGWYERNGTWRMDAGDVYVLNADLDAAAAGLGKGGES